ncbi:EamA family transporter RarD [Bacillus solitudinis]|uniref:EamA family transporter RarD n=1 Tax=Bacillus solitudinis TaxID=2014074 RepID=UPI000C233596|nr:EamA family transporter RarD [Bacillus solitudinis]
MKNEQVGVIAAIAAYLIWGVLPLFWKLFDEVSAGEVLAHRVIWTVVCMGIILLLIGKFTEVVRDIRTTFSHWKSALAIIAASVFISINWLVFIYSVSVDKVIEASLGYYINPLINVILALIFLKERLTKWEVFSCILAFSGVLYMTLHYGSIPWIAFFLAISFGIYGIIKKMTSLGAWAGLTIETFIMAPCALLYLYYLPERGGAFLQGGIETSILLMSAGVATAIPLLLFATAAKRISFSLIGFLQYLGPTIMLLIGIFLFNEPFSSIQFTSFFFIWLSLIIFSTSRSYASSRKKRELLLDAS